MSIKLSCRHCKETLIPYGTDIKSELADWNLRINPDTDSALISEATTKIRCQKCNTYNYILWEAKRVFDETASNQIEGP